MSNITISNVDLGSIVLTASPMEFQNDTVTVAANTTLLEGTILARDSSTGNLVPFVKGGSTNENGIPKTVLTYEVANETGAPVNSPVRVPLKASVRKQRLVIQADGDASNVDAPVVDQLRDYGITPVDTLDLSVLDNQ